MDVLFSASLFALILSASKSACAESPINTGATATIMNELNNLRSHVLSLEDKVIQQGGIIDDQQRVISSLQHQVTEHRRVIDGQLHNDVQELKLSDRENKRTIGLLMGKIDKVHQGDISNDDRKRASSPDEYQRTSFGCLGEVLTLTCENNRTINVTNAKYGKYEYTCADQESCCPPHPADDCIELVYENQPSDWVNLKYICDNKTSCSYEYLGSIIDDCEEEYTADYMHIFFTCDPEINDEPLGFSMSAQTKEYFHYEVARFNQTLTNLGGYYNTETCSFLCPLDGIYLFALTFHAETGFDMAVAIMMDSNVLTFTRAYSINDGKSQSSSFFIASCLAGQTVWSRCSSSNGGKMYDNDWKSIFSCYLLHTFV